MIGIIGGMGPESGIDLLQKIHQLTKAKQDQDHLPICLISSPSSIPDRSQFLLDLSKKNPAIEINKIIELLTTIGVNVIGIPCNSAHAPQIFKELKTPNNVRIIHMIEELVSNFKNDYPMIDQVGVLCTSGTLKTQIFQASFALIHVRVVDVSPEIQEKFIQPAIYKIKSGFHLNSSIPKEHLKKGIQYFIDRDIKTIILGCTEISLIDFREDYKEINLINPTEILAKALVNFYLENK